MSKYYDRVERVTEDTPLLDEINPFEETRRLRRGRDSIFTVEDSYTSRWTSIRLIYFTMFTNYVTFTATLASLWAYLKVLEPEAQAPTMGWVVSAFGMGQIIACPLFGIWANRRSIKEPLVISLLLNFLAYIFYMYLASLPNHRGYYMIAARWLVGFSSATVPLSRTYIAKATSLSERTAAIANTNIFGAVGFIFGPVLQASLVPISYPGLIESKAFHFNMYTAPILLSALASFITMVIIMFAFTEHAVKVEKPSDQQTSADRLHRTDAAVDYVAAVSCIIIFFCSFFNFTFLETIIVPLIMHMFAWSKAKATLIQSITIGGTALLSILVYIVIKVLSKRIKERTLLLCGFITSLMSYLVILPWGHGHPLIQMADIDNSTALQIHTTTSGIIFNSKITIQHFSNKSIIAPHLMMFSGIFTGDGVILSPYQRNGTTPTPLPSVGCPWQYSWCQTVPLLNLYQFVISLMLFGIGYPTTNLLINSIFSKILGPKPLGLWIGCLIASGCVAGIVGPILQSIIYDRYGPRVTFITVSGFMVVTILFVLCIFKRLKPYGEKKHEIAHSINNNGGYRVGE